VVRYLNILQIKEEAIVYPFAYRRCAHGIVLLAEAGAVVAGFSDCGVSLFLAPGKVIAETANTSRTALVITLLSFFS
jgi:hypothetical protein